MKKVLLLSCCLALLVGCSDPVVGKWNSKNTDASFIFSQNGTCQYIAGGLDGSCTWETNGENAIKIKILFGSASLIVKGLLTGDGLMVTSVDNKKLELYVKELK